MKVTIISHSRYGKTRLANYINAINRCDNEKELELIKRIYADTNNATKV